jgi:hypothetical protein
MMLLFIGPIVGVAVAIIAVVVIVSAVSGVIANELNDEDK